MTTNPPLTHPDTRATILVIDDERGPRESLRFLLKNEYCVLCADAVESGLELLKKHQPDTVIMDIRMPGLSGIDGLRKIRERDTDLAVIMLTGFAAIGTAQAAIRSDANDYIEKPFDVTEMLNAVQHHVEQTRLRRKRTRLLGKAELLEQRINKLKREDRLVELGQASTEFVHDLRNTLTAVNGYSSLLRTEMEEMQKQHADSPGEVVHYFDTLESSMQECVEMLNTWQHLIGQESQQKVCFQVHEFVRACVATCQSAAEVAHADVVVCKMIGDDAEILGERVQLMRALANLIHNAINAIKKQPPDRKRICVCSEILATSVRLSVSDKGIGIPPEHLQHLFSPRFHDPPPRWRHRIGPLHCAKSRPGSQWKNHR